MSDTREAVARLFGLDPESASFQQALTHPSYAHENKAAEDNQRLEFLGDSILGFCVSELLFQRFREADEGKLTRTRAQLVSAEPLAAFARSHGLPAAMRLGRGAQSAGLHDSTNVLADAVEALLAAAYLDGGLDAARVACHTLVEFGLARLERAGGRDPKSELQERVQARGHRPPSYLVVASGGPAHNAWFEVEVAVNGAVAGRAKGRTKRGAERAAALQALESLAASADVEEPAP